MRAITSAPLARSREVTYLPEYEYAPVTAIFMTALPISSKQISVVALEVPEQGSSLKSGSLLSETQDLNVQADQV